MAAILSPISLATAAVVALAGCLIETSGAGNQARGRMCKQFNGLEEIALGAWQAVSDAGCRRHRPLGLYPLADPREGVGQSLLLQGRGFCTLGILD